MKSLQNVATIKGGFGLAGFLRRPAGWLQAFLLGACVLLLSGCEQESSTHSYKPEYSAVPSGRTQRLEYRVGIHPLHNPELLFERYGPIVDAFNEAIDNAHFILEASRNYEEFENKLADGSLHIAMPNPYQTLAAQRNGYRVFGKMAGDKAFRGVVLVRKDGPIIQPADLAGQRVSFPSATALAATMMPQYELHKEGLAWGSYEPMYVGSQESSIMNVLLGQTVAGATWPTPWNAFKKYKPEQAAELRVLLSTPPLINNAWIARSDLPKELVEQVSEVLFGLHTSKQGQQILAELPLKRFEPASDADYEKVTDFVRDFAQTIRPVEL